MRPRLLAFSVLCGGLLFASRPARAGLVDGFDLISVTPFVGGQVVRALGGMPVSMAGATFASGVTMGGVAGIRLWPISLGVLVQRTAPSGAGMRELGVDRVYGELGLNSQLGKMLVSAHFDVGYAFLVDGASTIEGFGGKVGIALDYFPSKMLSIGAGGAFDLQAFPIERMPLVSVGGTFVGRLGLHL